MLVRKMDEGVEERNFAKEKLTRAEIEEIIAAVGIPAAINTRHEIAKANGWKAEPPTKKALVDAALEDNQVLRRPILIRGKQAVVGFDEDAIKELFGS